MASIAELFRESPFEPLRFHMDSVIACTSLVRPMFEALREQEYEKLHDLARKVFKAEHDADVIKDEIRQSVPKRFLLPVYRGDLLGYLKLQDDMADAVEDIAVLLTLKKVKLHESMIEPTFEFVDRVLDVCSATRAIADFLPTLVRSDMGGNEADQALQMIAKVEKTEWEADRLQYTASQKLFECEDFMSPADLMLIFRVYKEVGQLANSAEKTGDRLRRILSC